MKKIIFAYVQQEYFHPLPRELDMETPASLPLGLASVRAYAAADPEIARGAAFASRKYVGVTPAAAARAIARLRPDVAAFSCYRLNAPATLETCRELKRLLPGVAVVVGGAAVPKHAAGLKLFLKRNPRVDAAVFGEGEAAFACWLKAWLRGSAPESLYGLAIRGPRGQAIGSRPSVPDLASLPSPYLAGAARLLRRSGGSLSLETARGCPFACAYCATDAAGKTARFFPPERLERELAWLERQDFRGAVWVVDPIINLRREHAAAVFRIMARHRLLTMFNLKPELLDARLIGLISRIPRAGVAVGVQSTNPAALRNMGRPADLGACGARIKELRRRCPELGLGLQIILGLPGDDYESFKRTFDWTLAFGQSAGLSIMDLVLLENSPLYGQRARFGLKTDAEGLVTSNYSFSSADLARASRLAAVFHALQVNAGLLAAFDRACAGASPSAVLEKIALRALRERRLPAGRIIIDSAAAPGLGEDFLLACLEGQAAEAPPRRQSTQSQRRALRRGPGPAAA